MALRIHRAVALFALLSLLVYTLDAADDGSKTDSPTPDGSSAKPSCEFGETVVAAIAELEKFLAKQCKDLDCENGGTFIEEWGENGSRVCKCECKSGFKGETCSQTDRQITTDECSPAAVWRETFPERELPASEVFSEGCADVVVNLCDAMKGEEDDSMEVKNTFFYRGCMVISCEGKAPNVRMTISRDMSKEEDDDDCKNYPEYPRCPATGPSSNSCEALERISDSTKVLWKSMLCRAFKNAGDNTKAPVHKCPKIVEHLSGVEHDLQHVGTNLLQIREGTQNENNGIVVETTEGPRYKRPGWRYFLNGLRGQGDGWY